MSVCGVSAWVKSTQNLFKHMAKGIAYVSERKTIVNFGDEVPHEVFYDLAQPEQITIDGLQYNKLDVNHNDVIVYENNVLIARNEKHKYCVILIQALETADNSNCSKLAFLLLDRLNIIRKKQKHHASQQEELNKTERKPRQHHEPAQQVADQPAAEPQQPQESSQPTEQQALANSGNDFDQSQQVEVPPQEPSAPAQQEPSAAAQQEAPVQEPSQPIEQPVAETSVAKEPEIEKSQPAEAQDDADAGFD